MIVFDDLEPSEKLKIYDKGITLNGNHESVYQMMIGYRTGDMWSPHLDMTEALRTEGLHFIDCIQTGNRPITDGEAGLQIVRILEAATQSMKQQGRLIELDTAKVAV
jgi:predicted dehydrogenase